MSHSGYYASLRRPESQHSREDRRPLGVLVGEAHERSRRTYGSPRVHAELAAQGEQVSRKRVMRLMQEQGLQARGPPALQAHHRQRSPAPRGAQPTRPSLRGRAAGSALGRRHDELIIGEAGKLYLAAVLDLFSRFVVGRALSPVNDRHLVLKASEWLCAAGAPTARLLHHSDRGSPYASEDYQKKLAAHGITCSMSRRGNCIDNAPMETWFSTFKSEFGERFERYADAKEKAFDYIEVFYNQTRRHSALGYVSPAEFERSRRSETPAVEAAE